MPHNCNCPLLVFMIQPLVYTYQTTFIMKQYTRLLKHDFSCVFMYVYTSIETKGEKLQINVILCSVFIISLSDTAANLFHMSTLSCNLIFQTGRVWENCT